MAKIDFDDFIFCYCGTNYPLKTADFEGSKDKVFLEPKSRQKVAIKWSEQGRVYNIVEYDQYGKPNPRGMQGMVTDRQGAIDSACFQLVVNAGLLR